MPVATPPPTPVVITNIEAVGAEVLAESIVRLSKAADAMLKSGLSKRAICLLVKDHASIPMAVTERVIDALPQLAAKYVPQRK